MDYRITTLYVEECDCYERFGKCTHFNGGNYHRRDYLHTFTDKERYVIILEERTTREPFHGDKEEHLVYDGTHFELFPEDAPNDFPILAHFREGEARIIAQA